MASSLVWASLYSRTGRLGIDNGSIRRAGEARSVDILAGRSQAATRAGIPWPSFDRRGADFRLIRGFEGLRESRRILTVRSHRRARGVGEVLVRQAFFNVRVASPSVFGRA